ncbi:MAG: type II toxin-antitoxin system RelB/DinJ family antitoxin [Bifidobacteriaceae bacterium]|jgi:addiction module RelB/DinJ family antitoxin|nr:type II toxin-antitoxin system RelB/DinJ family antitoxin [Bifidobacteriaceae bacterium]
MSATLSVRIEPELKAEFLGVLKEVGLDAPSVIRMLAVQTVRERRIPLSLAAQSEPTSTMDFLDSVRASWGDW